MIQIAEVSVSHSKMNLNSPFKIWIDILESSFFKILKLILMFGSDLILTVDIFEELPLFELDLGSTIQ